MSSASANGRTRRRRMRRLPHPLSQLGHSLLVSWDPSCSTNIPAPSGAPDVLTDYTPAPRPGAPATTTAATNQHGHTPLPSATAQPSDMHSHPHQSASGPPTHAALPHSSLAPQLAPSSDAKIDPSNPTGIIPSTGTSVYDIDVAQFEGSGQMWRRPGSDISDWFNYGFDEVTYPRFLKYRQEMEQGRAALVSICHRVVLTSRRRCNPWHL